MYICMYIYLRFFIYKYFIHIYELLKQGDGDLQHDNARYNVSVFSGSRSFWLLAFSTHAKMKNVSIIGLKTDGIYFLEMVLENMPEKWEKVVASDGQHFEP